MFNLFRSVQAACVVLQTTSHVFIQSMTLLILDDSPVTQLCDMNELNYLALFPVKSNKLLMCAFLLGAKLQDFTFVLIKFYVTGDFDF